MFGTPTTYSNRLNSIAPTIYNTSPDGTPKAYMVWTLFDNEFNLVKSSSGMVKIPNTPDARQDIIKTDIIMDRGGYFYAYLVNESSMNVYFDDFQVTHITGKVLEENHYYPFGMLNAQLSVQPTDNPLNYYKYNGKELQKELNLEWLDYGARFYDAQVGRWHSVDRLADHPRQQGTAPYAFSANNPIRYIDPTGMIWEDPNQAERLNKSINSRIESIEQNSAKIQAQIDKGGLSEKKIAKLEGKLAENSQKTELLNQSLSDIKSIGNADETYKLAGPSSSDGTHGVVKGADGVIKIEGSNTGLHIHEMRHVGQSIHAGGVKFNKDGKLLNAATTKEGARNNEVNAYQVQYSYDGSYLVGASSLKDINGTTLMQIKTEDGRIVYEKLKD